MEILIITNDYPDPVDNWAGTAIRYPALSLAKEHNVRIIRRTPFPDWKLKGRNKRVPKQCKDHGMEVFYRRSFYTPFILKNLYGFWFFLSLFPLVKKLNHKRPISLIIAFFIYPDGFASILCSKLLKIPVISISRGSDINMVSHIGVMGKNLVSYTLANSNEIIAVSYDIKKKIVQMRQLLILCVVLMQPFL